MRHGDKKRGAREDPTDAQDLERTLPARLTLPILNKYLALALSPTAANDSNELLFPPAAPVGQFIFFVSVLDHSFNESLQQKNRPSRSQNGARAL